MQETQDSFYLRRTRPDKRKEASRKTIPPDGTIRELTGAASVKVDERGEVEWDLDTGKSHATESVGRDREREEELGRIFGKPKKRLTGRPRRENTSARE